MSGEIPIFQVIFGSLLVVAILAVIGIVVSVLCLHAMSGVKSRMATTERLDTLKAEMESTFEHKLKGAVQPSTFAINNLREELLIDRAAVTGIKSANDMLVRQMDQMSHNLLRIHDEQVKELLNIIRAERRFEPPAAPLPA